MGGLEVGYDVSFEILQDEACEDKIGVWISPLSRAVGIEVGLQSIGLVDVKRHPQCRHSAPTHAMQVKTLQMQKKYLQ